MCTNGEDLRVKGRSLLHRIEAKCFGQSYIKTVCLPPLVEERSEHGFHAAIVGTLRSNRESELGEMYRGIGGAADRTGNARHAGGNRPGRVAAKIDRDTPRWQPVKTA
jgi:hypothetical protein